MESDNLSINTSYVIISKSFKNKGKTINQIQNIVTDKKATENLLQIGETK